MKIIKTVRIKTHEGERLKDAAWNLSQKANGFILEPDLVHFLIEEFLDELDVKDGKLTRKETLK